MNIVLLNPRIKTWSPTIFAPIGLAYVASALEDKGHSVQIVDLNSRNVGDRELSKELVVADIIGITGMLTQYDEVIRLVELSKRCNAKVKVVLGGAMATIWTEKMLENSQADCVVMGEGERTAVELVSAIENVRSLKNLNGVAYKIENRIVVNPTAEPIANPDIIMFPARHLLNMKRYTASWFKGYDRGLEKVKSVVMFTSRGCSYNCSFCCCDVWGHKWRGRSPENIINEIKQLQRDYGYDGFVFFDDTFVLDRQRVFDFCKKVKEEKLDIVWICNGRINLMTEELIKAMSQAGCKGIYYGIESGNQQVLDFMQKQITLEQVETVTRLTEEAGIKATGLFMLGYLGETRTTIQQTLDFARKLNLNFYGFALTLPILGTKLYEQAKEQGLVAQTDLRDDWSYHANTNLTVDCTKEELEQFARDAYKEFTLEKQYGKRYLFNPSLWQLGFDSFVFMVGKRPTRELIKRVFGIAKGR